MNKFPDFWSIVVGKGPLGYFLGYLAICYVAAFASLLWSIANRDVTSPNTPVTVSWKFFSISNLARILMNILLIPIFIRLVYQYFDPVWMMLMSVGIGAGVDRLGPLFKKLGIFTTDQAANKFMQKIAPDQPTVTPPPAKP